MKPGDDSGRPGRRPLQQVLGIWGGAAVGVGVAIGAGIFRTPGYVASFLGTPEAILAVWILGGLLVIGDALILAELASRHPRAGGWFVYIEKGWGGFPAFVYGWAFTLVVDPASSAALVVVLGEYLSSLAGIGAGAGRLWAIGVTLSLFALSLAGVRVGSRTQQFLTWGKLLALVGVGLLAFLLPSAHAGAPAVAPATEAVATGGFLVGLLAVGKALQGVLWPFEGYANTTTMTEESVNPRRTLPRALIGGTVALALVYLLVNAAYLHVLGRDGLAASQLPGADISARLFGAAGQAVFLGVAILAAVGSLNGAVLSAPRVVYALARSGLAPEPLTRVSRTGTPDLATLWFALAWTVYAALGSFTALVSVSIFVGTLANVAVTAALFRIRAREDRGAPPAPGIFRCPGYPLLPLVMLLLWGTLAGAVLWSEGWRVGYGLALIALAAPAYLFWRRGAGGKTAG